MASLLAGLGACSGDPAAAPPSPAAPSRRAAGDALAASIERALRAGDGTSAASLAARGASSVTARLRAAADNARTLGLTRVRLDYQPDDGVAEVPGGGPWPGTLDISWRPASGGVADLSLPLQLVWDGDRASVASLGDGAERLPLWLAGPLEVRRGEGWQVAVRGSDEAASRLAAAGRRAVRGVRRVLALGGVVEVELPADAAEYDGTLGGRPGEYAGLAAVTTTADGSVRPGVPLRIVLNPTLWAGADDGALALLLAHESVHVAMRDVTSPGPRWLSEGLADTVALRALDGRPATRAAAALARAQGVPTRLPRDADFHGSGRALEAAYEQAWLACRVIVAAAGARGLIRVRRAVAAGRPVDEALRQVVGLSEAELVVRWRRRLTALAW